MFRVRLLLCRLIFRLVRVMVRWGGVHPRAGVWLVGGGFLWLMFVRLVCYVEGCLAGGPQEPS